jgi:hypothetical protein
MDPAFMKFSSTWNFFIDSMMNEWRAFNIVSLLLPGFVLYSPLNDRDTEFPISLL